MQFENNEKETIFLPIDFLNYKTGKIKTLKAQLKIGFLISQFKKLEEARKIKHIYKIQAKKLLLEIQKSSESLIEIFPTPDIAPIKKIERAEKKQEREFYHEPEIDLEKGKKRIEMNEELRKIHEKLKNLKI